MLAYSLSMNPWSHVLTLYLRTSLMVSSRPSSPRPFPSGRLRASSRTKSSGLWALTRVFFTTPRAFGSNSPAALDGIASSASRTKGTIRAFMASMSCQHVSVALAWGDCGSYMFDFIGPV